MCKQFILYAYDCILSEKAKSQFRSRCREKLRFAAGAVLVISALQWKLVASKKVAHRYYHEVARGNGISKGLHDLSTAAT